MPWRSLFGSNTAHCVPLSIESPMYMIRPRTLTYFQFSLRTGLDATSGSGAHSRLNRIRGQ
jgi:hypothetical protein